MHLYCPSLPAPQAAQQAAEGRAADAAAQVANLSAEVAALQQQLTDRSDDLTTQRAVNTQLMLKKEEVEWQLMAALAKVGGGRTFVQGRCLVAISSVNGRGGGGRIAGACEANGDPLPPSLVRCHMRVRHSLLVQSSPATPNSSSD
jgi:hypothetical protein